jgi:hypothetical protein
MGDSESFLMWQSDNRKVMTAEDGPSGISDLQGRL